MDLGLHLDRLDLVGVGHHLPPAFGGRSVRPVRVLVGVADHYALGDCSEVVPKVVFAGHDLDGAVVYGPLARRFSPQELQKVFRKAVGRFRSFNTQTLFTSFFVVLQGLLFCGSFLTSSRRSFLPFLPRTR